MIRAQKCTLRRDGAAWVITIPSGGTWMMSRRRLPGTGVWEEAVLQAHQIALETQIRDAKHAELFPCPKPESPFDLFARKLIHAMDTVDSLILKVARRSSDRRPNELEDHHA